jgi:hypothetical protein
MKYFCSAMLLILLAPAALNAQFAATYDPGISRKAVESIEYIAASIISDSFSPMTRYSTGDTFYSVVPAGFEADRLWDDPEINGENFYGASLGAGCGYAITGELMAYVILAGMGIRGNMEMNTYGDVYGSLSNDSEYMLLNISGGAGYDIFRNNFVSIPVYLGLNLQYFSAEFTCDPVSYTSGVTYTVNNTTSGSGLLAGMSGGIAASFRVFSSFIITPYYLYLQNFNSGSMKAEFKLSSAGLPVTESARFDLDPVSAGMFGLNIGYKNESGFSFSIALGSLISSLTGYGSKASDNGLEIKTIVLIFSYNSAAQ